jgi:hypothetical protein
MKLTLKQKLLSGLAILFIVLIITNPSAQVFKEYSGYSTYEGLHRNNNFFICSIYRRGGNKYLGIVGNFFKISRLPIDTTSQAPPIDFSADSSKHDTTKINRLR